MPSLPDLCLKSQRFLDTVSVTTRSECIEFASDGRSRGLSQASRTAETASRWLSRLSKRKIRWLMIVVGTLASYIKDAVGIKITQLYSTIIMFFRMRENINGRQLRVSNRLSQSAILLPHYPDSLPLHCPTEQLRARCQNMPLWRKSCIA
ncbi:hypothetical protein B0H13DRAFT_268544 [Mycena leptocephala]|nr:hypothetical protein B0H13DRAFT_268544 [Mycena leptocephala]